MEEKLHASSSAVLHHSHIHTYIERISSLEPAAVELSSAAQILGGLASAFQSACYGRIANDYAGGRQEAMQASCSRSGLALRTVVHARVRPVEPLGRCPVPAAHMSAGLREACWQHSVVDIAGCGDSDGS